MMLLVGKSAAHGGVLAGWIWLDYPRVGSNQQCHLWKLPKPLNFQYQMATSTFYLQEISNTSPQIMDFSWIICIWLVLNYKKNKVLPEKSPWFLQISHHPSNPLRHREVAITPGLQVIVEPDPWQDDRMTGDSKVFQMLENDVSILLDDFVECWGTLPDHHFQCVNRCHMTGW